MSRYREPQLQVVKDHLHNYFQFDLKRYNANIVSLMLLRLYIAVFEGYVNNAFW